MIRSESRFAANKNIRVFANHMWFADSHLCESCESYDSQWFAFLRIMRIIWFAWFAFLRILRIIWFAWFAFLRITRIIDSQDSQNTWFAANKNIRTEKYSLRILWESYDLKDRKVESKMASYNRKNRKVWAKRPQNRSAYMKMMSYWRKNR